MDALNFNHLFWLRHGVYKKPHFVEVLDALGKQQMRHAASKIATILASEERRGIVPFVSEERRAIESVYAIQDALEEFGADDLQAPRMITYRLGVNNVFYSPSSGADFDTAVSLMNSLQRHAKNCLAVTHSDSFLGFPSVAFPGIVLPEESNMGDMLHVNLRTGESEYFSSRDYDLAAE